MIEAGVFISKRGLSVKHIKYTVYARKRFIVRVVVGHNDKPHDRGT